MVWPYLMMRWAMVLLDTKIRALNDGSERA